jgi:uroporphyrinogen decarboxylase
MPRTPKHPSPQKTGKELIAAAMRHQATERVPWVPFAGVHAGKLKGYDAQEVLTDGEKLLDSLVEVNKLYNPDGQPVLFDLQLEAEILGCKLLWSKLAPPSVATHPLEATKEIPTHIPGPDEGRLPLVLDAMRALKEKVGSTTALYGLVCGPLTLASHLRGTEIFMDMMKDPVYLFQLLSYASKVALRMSELYVQAGMDVIGIVDPLVSQISPRHFVQYMSLPYKDIFSGIKELGVFSSFFVCGDATKNIEPMCQTNPDSISIDENINLANAKQITERYNITLGGNIPLTTKLLLGNQQDNMAFVLDLLDHVSHHNFILSPGCDMPYDTPIENVIAVLQTVRDPKAVRKILINYQVSEFISEIALPDYQNLSKPLIEVFTLDSDTCAACGYMLGAAKRVAAGFPGKVDLVEYKFTEAENIARVQKLGIKNLPSILINGELKFSSLIPSHEEFVALVQSTLEEMNGKR